MRTSLRLWYGRWPVAWAIAAAALVFVIAWLATGSTYSAWRFLGVRSLSPSFADLRAVTHLITCVGHGIDPRLSGACDPWGRLYNLPSTWLTLGRFLGVSAASTNLIGCALIALLCGALLLIFKTRTAASGIIAFVAVLSPPVLLLAERGNVDVLMFVPLVASAYLLATRTGLGARLIQCGVIVVLTVFKIYPLAGAIVLFRRKYEAFVLVVMAGLALAGLVGVIGIEELKAIARNTPQTIDLSYGDMTIFIAASDRGLLPSRVDPGQLRLLATTVALFLAACAAALSLWRPGIVGGRLPSLRAELPSNSVTMSCMAVFCLSFLMGANFDYRLVFLVGVLPALLESYDTEGRIAALFAAALIVLFLWLSRLSSHVIVPFEILDWSIFLIGVMWLTPIALRRPQASMAGHRRAVGVEAGTPV